MRCLPDDIQPQELARLVIEEYIQHREKLSPPANPQGVLAERAGVFVTLKTRDKQLRGCIGTFLPSEPTVAHEIIRNAINAATRDPRFLPVEPQELDSLSYSVDVLSPPEEVPNSDWLDPQKYGVMIHSEDGHHALLLPAIEGLDTVEKQLSAARRKAGITEAALIRIQRFTVRRFGEK